MRIIILGAGQIGEQLARTLVSDENDIVLIDTNAEILDSIRSHIDIQTITGHAASPTVLLEAGIEQTDLLIAVTASDEINMIACVIARKIFQAPKTIARIRSQDYHQFPDLFKKNIFPVDTIIYPTKNILQHMLRMIKYPEFSQILTFCQDKVYMVTVEIQTQDWMHNKTLAELEAKIAKQWIHLVAIFHKKQSISLDETYELQEDDKVLFIAREQHLSMLLKQLQRPSRHNSRIMLAGGGRIGSELAKHLEHEYQVKLIEISPVRAEKNASQLTKTLVIEGDVGDRELLLSENIEDIDMFFAITNHDETNIMASLQAKYLGANYAMALVSHENYLDLIDGSGIDTALSPQNLTLSNILSQVRANNMIKVHRLQEEEAEAVELLVEGTERNSAVIGRPITDIELPAQCILAGIVRGKKLYFAPSNLVIAAKDRIIFLVLNQKCIRELEALFGVNLMFMS